MSLQYTVQYIYRNTLNLYWALLPYGNLLYFTQSYAWRFNLPRESSGNRSGKDVISVCIYLNFSLKRFNKWRSSHCLCLNYLIIQSCLDFVYSSQNVNTSVSVLCGVENNFVPIIYHFLHRFLKWEFLKHVKWIHKFHPCWNTLFPFQKILLLYE